MHQHRRDLAGDAQPRHLKELFEREALLSLKVLLGCHEPGDIGPNHRYTAVGHSAFIHLVRSPIRQFADNGISSPQRAAFFQPLLLASDRLRDSAGPHAGQHQVLPAAAQSDMASDSRPDLGIVPVEGNKPIVSIVYTYRLIDSLEGHRKHFEAGGADATLRVSGARTGTGHCSPDLRLLQATRYQSKRLVCNPIGWFNSTQPVKS